MVYAIMAQHSVGQPGREDGLTSSHFVDLVLDEEIYQGNEGPKEKACEDLPPFACSGIIGAQGKAAQRPWESRDEIGDHEDVVPVVVICRRHICPTPTRYRSEESHPADELWQRRLGMSCHHVPQEDEGESRTYCATSANAFPPPTLAYRM
jgi:hypothetical protein